nr:immunoglobulin light chain junction region [Macaca mulatta]MPO11982.1 immunoglobulin light chain junction region [Macaca mulatta]MPO12918.1 immunoglobulin light chain junction region [Macaca mulatta]
CAVWDDSLRGYIF